MFYVESQAILFVYDITNLESFEILKKTYEEVKEFVDINKVYVFIVGNKSDLYYKEKVNKIDVEEYSKSINGIFKCVSALSDEGIIELFECIGKTLLLDNKKIIDKEERELKEKQSVKLTKNKRKKPNKNKCCAMK